MAEFQEGSVDLWLLYWEERGNSKNSAFGTRRAAQSVWEWGQKDCWTMKKTRVCVVGIAVLKSLVSRLHLVTMPSIPDVFNSFLDLWRDRLKVKILH